MGFGRRHALEKSISVELDERDSLDWDWFLKLDEKEVTEMLRPNHSIGLMTEQASRATS